MLFNSLLDLKLVEPKRSSIFDNQVKIRKAWVHVVNGTPLEIRLLSYPREVRFGMYAAIDNCVRLEYIRLMREYNQEQRDSGHSTDRTILGVRILHKSVQMDPHMHLAKAAMDAIEKLAPTIEMS
jgi:hypothetical protein